MRRADDNSTPHLPLGAEWVPQPSAEQEKVRPHSARQQEQPTATTNLQAVLEEKEGMMEMQHAASLMADHLSMTLRKKVLITLTHNRKNIISFRVVGREIRLRMHYLLPGLGESFMQGMVEWLRDGGRSGAPKVVRESVRNQPIPDQPERNRRRNLRQAGDVYDLLPLFDEVNHRFFDGKVSCDVTWGRKPVLRRVRVRIMGSYSPSNNLIVIHPVLDDSRVPEMVVKFILFHEMLHAMQPEGHRRRHDKAFLEAERAHPDYEKVEKWMAANHKLTHGR